MRFPLLFLALIWGCADPSIPADPTPAPPTEAPFLVVLGIGQDGGVP